jgi:hypothetical protein
MGTKQQAQYAAKFSSGQTVPFQLNGAPTSGAGGSFAGRAVVGSQLIDLALGKVYVCTASGGGSVTWTLVGSQA